jgi:hypothetical protein
MNKLMSEIKLRQVEENSDKRVNPNSSDKKVITMADKPYVPKDESREKPSRLTYNALFLWPL